MKVYLTRDFIRSFLGPTNMSRSSSRARNAQGIKITNCDVTTWSWVNLMNPYLSSLPAVSNWLQRVAKILTASIQLHAHTKKITVTAWVSMAYLWPRSAPRMSAFALMLISQHAYFSTFPIYISWEPDQRAVYSCNLSSCRLLLAVYNLWTELVDWTGGLDWWNLCGITLQPSL